MTANTNDIRVNALGVAVFRSIKKKQSILKKSKPHISQSKAWHTPPLLAFLALSGFKASSSIHHEPLSKQQAKPQKHINIITYCNSTLPSCLSFCGALVWSYFFLWLLHSFWESWSNQTPWAILLIPTSTRINVDQAEKSIKPPLMVFVYGRDAERRAHALSCELSPSVFQKTRLLLSGVPQ